MCTLLMQFQEKVWMNFFPVTCVENASADERAGREGVLAY